VSDDREAARIIDRRAGETPSPLDANPQLRTFIECWLDTFILNGTVDVRLRQLTILRLAWRSNQPFEWANHYKLAVRKGVTDDEIRAVQRDDPEMGLDGEARIVVRAADEVIDVGYLTPETYAACREVFEDPGVLHEFVHVAAGYRMQATILNTTRPSVVAAGLPWWPPDGVGPDGATTPPDA
jgi:hypothetical protein